jgi:glyoxylase-like metal-dependent hydrolase (beta-lactamase superfamily II)
LDYLNSDTAALRLTASRDELFPWIDDRTRLVPADRWLDEDAVLELGGERFHIHHGGPAHTPEDLVVHAERAGVMFAGDLVFRGRIPFVGQADSQQWIASLGRLIDFKAHTIVPGHGPVSRQPQDDLQLTRDYLLHLRQTMAEAAANPNVNRLGPVGGRIVVETIVGLLKSDPTSILNNSSYRPVMNGRPTTTFGLRALVNGIARL